VQRHQHVLRADGAEMDHGFSRLARPGRAVPGTLARRTGRRLRRWLRLTTSSRTKRRAWR